MSGTTQGFHRVSSTDSASALERLTDTDAWIEYALEHSRQVQTTAADLDLPVHLCPHWHLVQATDGETEAWFRAWRERRPPEPFAGGSSPESPPPTPPEP